MTELTYNTPAFTLPDLVEIQRASFRWFLEEGLIEELDSFSPITDYTGKLELHFLGKDYKLKRPKYDVDEAKRRDSTYAVQMYVPTRLVNKETGEIKEQEVFIGDLPLMTDREPSSSTGQNESSLIRLSVVLVFTTSQKPTKTDGEPTMPA